MLQKRHDSLRQIVDFYKNNDYINHNGHKINNYRNNYYGHNYTRENRYNQNANNYNQNGQGYYLKSCRDRVSTLYKHETPTEQTKSTKEIIYGHKNVTKNYELEKSNSGRPGGSGGK